MSNYNRFDEIVKSLGIEGKKFLTYDDEDELAILETSAGEGESGEAPPEDVNVTLPSPSEKGGEQGDEPIPDVHIDGDGEGEGGDGEGEGGDGEGGDGEGEGGDREGEGGGEEGGDREGDDKGKSQQDDGEECAFKVGDIVKPKSGQGNFVVTRVYKQNGQCRYELSTATRNISNAQKFSDGGEMAEDADMPNEGGENSGDTAALGIPEDELELVVQTTEIDYETLSNRIRYWLNWQPNLPKYCKLLYEGEVKKYGNICTETQYFFSIIFNAVLYSVYRNAQISRQNKSQVKYMLEDDADRFMVYIRILLGVNSGTSLDDMRRGITEFLNAIQARTIIPSSVVELEQRLGYWTALKNADDKYNKLVSLLSVAQPILFDYKLAIKEHIQLIMTILGRKDLPIVDGWTIRQLDDWNNSPYRKAYCVTMVGDELETTRLVRDDADTTEIGSFDITQTDVDSNLAVWKFIMIFYTAEILENSFTKDINEKIDEFINYAFTQNMRVYLTRILRQTINFA
jgi:hypothetical protein